MCGVDQVPYQSTATKKCHFTVLGVTISDNIGLMCVVIIQGRKQDIMCKTGIDWGCLVDEETSSFDINEGEEDKFFRQISGKIRYSLEDLHVIIMILKYRHASLSMRMVRWMAQFSPKYLGGLII